MRYSVKKSTAGHEGYIPWAIKDNKTGSVVAYCFTHYMAKKIADTLNHGGK